MIGGILGIVLLAMILICAGIYVGFHERWQMEEISLALCLGVTALCVGLAYRLGQQSLKNRLIFCLDEEDRLFVVEAGKYIRTGSGLTGYISLAHRTQKEIGELTAPGGLLERGMSRATDYFRRADPGKGEKLPGGVSTEIPESGGRKTDVCDHEGL